MASTELPNSAEHSEKEDRLDANHTDSKSIKELTTGADGVSDARAAPVARSRDASPASLSSTSGPSSSKGGTQSPAPSSSGNTPPLSMPHPKKFSHVNINKKFLEKTSSASAPPHTIAASPALKAANSSQKAVQQTTASHPRLVTAKLTAAPQPSSTAGWSRSSSTVPSSAPTPNPTSNPKPSTAPATSSTAAPLPPPVGKVIQPQPRSSQDALFARKDGSSRPVWGNAKGGAVAPLDRVQADFPTAAEVAQAAGRVPKSSDKAVSNDANAQKQAAEADTFRGVHLDPNAHHWDEMEEDDDNFLGGVIEFGDGRQYKVQSSEARATSPPKDTGRSPTRGEPHEPGRGGTMDQPVSKEERFADDFDRSWPRSRPGYQSAAIPRDQRSNGTPTSPASTSVHSPQEPSRQLFNERSNRLEPYSHLRHGGPGAPSHLNRRGSRPDYVTSPTEPRRDAPPHAHSQGVQLLQKGPNEGPPDGPPFVPRAPDERSPTSPADSRFRDRQSHRQDNPPWQTEGPPGPGRGHTPYGTHPPRRPRDAPFDDRRRTSGNETLSPIGLDTRRQLPPHLSSPGLRNVPTPRIDGDGQSRSPVPLASALPSAEPATPSADGQLVSSPVDSEQSTGPVVDVEEVRKAAMHNAAERARLRRQQEEEEREREKERARKKAAEIEERMKAMEDKAREREKVETEKQKTEAQVLGLIEEAVSSVAPLEKRTDSQPDDQHGIPAPPTFGRSASSRGAQRTVPPRRTSFPASSAVPVAPSPASEADTWRRKGPLSPPRRPESQELPPSSVLPPPVLAHTDLDVKEGEDVDVVDFADLGKLVGSENPSQPPASVPAARAPRAVAADFFAEQPLAVPRPQPPPSRADEGPWRRQSAVANGHLPHVERQSSTEAVVESPQAAPDLARSSEPAGPNSAVSPPPWYDEHHRRMSGHPQNGIHKSPQGPYYREAPMSTLNDVMARIKGAIDGMHHDVDVPKEVPKDAPKESPKEVSCDASQDIPQDVSQDVLKEAPQLQKWLPPAKRPKTAPADIALPTEVFDVTATEPPKSPKKAWNKFSVKIAIDSRPIQADPTTQLVWPRSARFVRLEVESWNPPLDHRHRRAASVNDIIFGGPHYVHGQPKYSVMLPRRRITRRPIPGVEQASSPPVVNLPASPPRPRNTATTETQGPSWRKASVSPAPSWKPLPKQSAPDVGLDTVSRSPPPETPSTKPTLLVPDTTGSSSASANAGAKKMPAGADVAFYRTAVEPQGQVQFIVTSELEGSSKSDPVAVEPKPTPSEVLPPVQSVPKVEDATANVPNGLSTPPQQTTSLASQWSKSPKALGLKESPSRAPDPEHLKAVWSQTSDKTQNPPVNSLKGIVDDLTGVPFSLQDVKSDDGETPPPPSSSGPWSKSKMSAYDVTRAFQQVPSSSGSSSQSRPAPIAPSMSTSSSTNGTAPRHPGFAFSPPPVNQPGLRPPSAYPTYSPMMGHAQAAPVMYTQPSPVPRPMVVNGQPPAYGQPVWMPAMPGPGPPPSSGVMRSPYPTQIVPYPSPGGTMPMYSPAMPGMQNPQMQPPPPPQQNGAHGRPMGMPLVSPVMQHAMPPMYAGSPVLIHTPPHVAPGQPYPAPGHPNRGPMAQHPSPGTPHMHHSPMRPQNGYNQVPSSYPSAPRPAW